MAIGPTISLKGLRNAAVETGKTTRSLQTFLNSSIGAKKNLYSSIKIVKKRREDSYRRKVLRTQLIAPSLVTRTTGPKILATTTQQGLGIGDRLIGFLKYATAGWLLGNIPTWTALGRQFIGRVQNAGSILRNYGDETLSVLTGITDVFKATLTNISTFDFLDTSSRLKDSLGDLKSNVDDLGKGIVDAFNVIIQPFTDIPPLGSDQLEREKQQQQQQTRQPTPSPAPSGGGGGENQTKASVGTKEQKAMLDAIAWAEGGVSYRTMFGGGQFDTSRGWKHPDTVVRGRRYSSAAAGRYQFMPGTWANAAKALGLNDFSPINQDKAAIWLMDRRLGGNSAEILRREGVSNRVLNAFAGEWAAVPMARGGSFYGQPARKVREFKNKYDSLLKTTPEQVPTPTPTSRPGSVPLSNFAAVSGTSGSSMRNRPLRVDYSPFKPGSGATITSAMGLRWGREHKGYDLAAPSGTPVYAYFSGTVTHIGVERTATDAGYGNWLVWKDDVYGSYHFFGHLLKPVKLKKGERFNQGALLGYVGNTGASYGPHLHWEISNQAPDPSGNFTTRENIPNWLKSHPIKKSSAQITSRSRASVPLVPIAPATTAQEDQQAQIDSSYREGLVEGITQERQGRKIVVIDDRSSPIIQQVMSGGGDGIAFSINESALLNNFIKNKLLLDLNYV